jgi:hypothetical protein
MPNGKATTTVSATIPPLQTSIVHSGAAPLLQSNNPSEIHAGIDGSVLDLLLPTGSDDKSGNASNIANKMSWNTLTQKTGESGQLNSAIAANAFEQFRKQAREKEEKVR